MGLIWTWSALVPESVLAGAYSTNLPRNEDTLPLSSMTTRNFPALMPSAPPTVSAPVTSTATKTRRALRNMRLLSVEGGTLYLLVMEVKLPPLGRIAADSSGSG
jgi:hypothetical protein